ncbi:hypothetical protein Dimus_018828 [Dionaea muscipula]
MGLSRVVVIFLVLVIVAMCSVDHIEATRMLKEEAGKPYIIMGESSSSSSVPAPKGGIISSILDPNGNHNNQMVNAKQQGKLLVPRRLGNDHYRFLQSVPSPGVGH